jgi:hypothetical protein
LPLLFPPSRDSAAGDSVPAFFLIKAPGKSAAVTAAFFVMKAQAAIVNVFEVITLPFVLYPCVL